MTTSTRQPAALWLTLGLTAACGAGAIAAEPDADAARTAVHTYSDGVPVVALDLEAVRGAGIRTAKVGAETRVGERHALAQVIDPVPLLDWRERYRTGAAARDARAGEAAAARRTLGRLRALHEAGDNVSARRVEEAQADAEVAAANARAAAARLEGLRAKALTRWGRVLTDALGTESADAFARIVNGEQVLLLLTLAPGETLPADLTTIAVDAGGTRAHARPAVRLDAAPGGIGAGETWWFSTDATRLRVGMRLDAWIPVGPARAVTRVPERAVVWFGGRPWVYVELGPGRYARRDVGSGQVLGEDRYLEHGLPSDAVVVVTGAQLLLSEEARGNIPDEEEID